MDEIGISLEGHRAKPYGEYMGKKHFAFLITVCAEAEKRCPRAFPGFAQRIHWPFDVPASVEGSEEQKLQKFRQIREQINHRIKDWLKIQGVEIPDNPQA